MVNKTEAEGVVLITVESIPFVKNTTSDVNELEELCIGRQSGLYAKGCSGDVLWCTDGAATHLSCPPGYLYEQESRRCVPRESMAECPPDLVPLAIAQLVTTSKTPTQTITSGKTTEVNKQATVRPIEVTPPQKLNFPCASLSDGVHSKGCSKFFVVCIEHEMIVKQCPEALFYDSVSDSCLPKESVQLCANEETNEITGSVEAIATSSTDGSGVPRGPAPISDSFCENHEDGTYGERCSARFVLCLSHETLFFNCSDSFVFDPIASECVPLSPTQMAISPQSDIQTIEAGEKDIDHSKRKPKMTRRRRGEGEDEDERGRGGVFSNWGNVPECEAVESLPAMQMEGFKATGRSAIATAGTSTTDTVNKRFEEEETSEDEETAEDEEASEYEEMAEDEEASEGEGTSEEEKEVADFDAVAPEIMELDPSDENFGSSCVGMKDGPIALGCSSDFIVCDAGRAKLHRCPFGLKYDTNSHMCVRQLDVPACIEGAMDLSVFSDHKPMLGTVKIEQSKDEKASAVEANSGRQTDETLLEATGSVIIEAQTITSTEVSDNGQIVDDDTNETLGEGAAREPEMGERKAASQIGFSLTEQRPSLSSMEKNESVVSMAKSITVLSMESDVLTDAVAQASAMGDIIATTVAKESVEPSSDQSGGEGSEAKGFITTLAENDIAVPLTTDAMSVSTSEETIAALEMSTSKTFMDNFAAFSAEKLESATMLPPAISSSGFVPVEADGDKSAVELSIKQGASEALVEDSTMMSSLERDRKLQMAESNKITTYTEGVTVGPPEESPIVKWASGDSTSGYFIENSTNVGTVQKSIIAPLVSNSLAEFADGNTAVTSAAETAYDATSLTGSLSSEDLASKANNIASTEALEQTMNPSESFAASKIPTQSGTDTPTSESRFTVDAKIDKSGHVLHTDHVSAQTSADFAHTKSDGIPFGKQLEADVTTIRRVEGREESLLVENLAGSSTEGTLTMSRIEYITELLSTGSGSFENKWSTVAVSDLREDSPKRDDRTTVGGEESSSTRYEGSVTNTSVGNVSMEGASEFSPVKDVRTALSAREKDLGLLANEDDAVVPSVAVDGRYEPSKLETKKEIMFATESEGSTGIILEGETTASDMEIKMQSSSDAGTVTAVAMGSDESDGISTVSVGTTTVADVAFWSETENARSPSSVYGSETKFDEQAGITPFTVSGSDIPTAEWSERSSTLSSVEQASMTHVIKKLVKNATSASLAEDETTTFFEKNRTTRPSSEGSMLMSSTSTGNYGADAATTEKSVIGSSVVLSALTSEEASGTTSVVTGKSLTADGEIEAIVTPKTVTSENIDFSRKGESDTGQSKNEHGGDLTVTDRGMATDHFVGRTVTSEHVNEMTIAIPSRQSMTTLEPELGGTLASVTVAGQSKDVGLEGQESQLKDMATERSAESVSSLSFNADVHSSAPNVHNVHSSGVPESHASISGLSTELLNSPATYETSTEKTDTTVRHSAHPALTNFSCAGLPDGPYSLGCSAQLVICLNEMASVFHCADGLVYSVDSEQCADKSEVRACIGETDDVITEASKVHTVATTPDEALTPQYSYLTVVSDPSPTLQVTTHDKEISAKTNEIVNSSQLATITSPFTAMVSEKGNTTAEGEALSGTSGPSDSIVGATGMWESSYEQKPGAGAGPSIVTGHEATFATVTVTGSTTGWSYHQQVPETKTAQKGEDAMPMTAMAIDLEGTLHERVVGAENKHQSEIADYQRAYTPTVSSSTSAHEAVVSGSASAHEPVVTSSTSSNEPAVSGIASAHEPALSGSAIEHEPAVSSSTISHEPAVSSSTSAHEPALSGSAIEHEPAVSSSTISHEPALSGSAIAHEPAVSSSTIAREPAVIGSTTAREPVVTSSTRAHEPAVSGSTSSYEPALSGPAIAHEPAVSSTTEESLTQTSEGTLQPPIMVATDHDAIAESQHGTATNTEADMQQTFSCVGLADGPRAIGCSSSYVICLFGMTNWLHCEGDKKFNEETLQCMPAVNVTACAGYLHADKVSTTMVTTKANTMMEPAKQAIEDNRTSEPEISVTSSAPNVSSQTEGPTLESVISSSVEDISKLISALPPAVKHEDSPCSALPDGIYGVGCSRVILWFVRDCRETRKTQAVAAWPSLVYMGAPGLTNDVDFDGGKLRVSTLGRATQMIVEIFENFSGLFEQAVTFSMEDNRYQIDKNTAHCFLWFANAVERKWGRQETPTKSTKEDNVAALSLGIAVPVKPTTRLPISPEFSCEGQEGGFFVSGCSSIYASCKEQPYGLRFCPESLVFDERSNECRDKNVVDACREAILRESATEEPVRTSSTSSEATQRNEETTKWGTAAPTRKMTVTAPLRDSRSSCRGREDGYYDIGCSGRFFSCLGEKTTILQCDLGLKFDVISGECMPKRYVQACGGRSKVPPRSLPIDDMAESLIGPFGIGTSKHTGRSIFKRSISASETSGFGH
ncbi:unnamed protein product [Toxocara canis]|uniref:Chondroitin proteoglycan 2 n=1 Tax=Toxocara canis TaxID=6265 RepID=A0A183UNA1_TOXCA|nr:unnamed protein product [Toxocara canis]